MIKIKRPPEPLPDGSYRIPLTRGLYAVVDAADIDEIGRHNWCSTKSKGHFYAVTGNGTASPRIYMHHLVAQRCGLGASSLPCVDHFDRDSLNNRRGNLRGATYGQNRANSKVTGAIPFKGVYLCKGGRYMAQIRSNRKNTYLGRFDTPEEAARAHDAAAAIAHGEFATLNFKEYDD